MIYYFLFIILKSYFQSNSFCGTGEEGGVEQAAPKNCVMEFCSVFDLKKSAIEFSISFNCSLFDSSPLCFYQSLCSHTD